MKIIKRSQLAVLSLSLMIMIAGYINYKYDEDREKDLGKTVHVSSSDAFLYETSNKNVDVYNEEETSSKNNQNLYNKKVNDTISVFKSNRDNMFSELETTYNQAINNTSTSKEDIKIYQDKLNDLVKKKHLISIVENLIKTKGITDIVIVPTNDNYKIIVKSEKKLTDTQVAIIQQIMKDELGVDANRITITEE